MPWNLALISHFFVGVICYCKKHHSWWNNWTFVQWKKVITWLYSYTYVLTPPSCFVYFDNIFNFLSTYRTESTFMVFHNYCTFKAHAHVSTGVQHGIHSTFIAHCALASFCLRTWVHGSLRRRRKRFDISGFLLRRHWFRRRDACRNTVTPHHTVVGMPWWMNDGTRWCRSGATEGHLCIVGVPGG